MEGREGEREEGGHSDIARVEFCDNVLVMTLVNPVTLMIFLQIHGGTG